VLGFAREATYGYFFGTGPVLSSFRIAFMIPNLSRRLFGEGALSAAFIPVFVRTLQAGDSEHARRLAGGVLTLLGAVLLGLIAIGEVFLLGAEAMHRSLTLRLTALMFPFMGFICMAAFLGGLLNTLGKFGAPAASPMILNAFVIAGILVAAFALGLANQVRLVYVACLAVLVAGVAQVGVQIFALRHTGFRPALNFDWSQPELREIVAFMAPMIVGLSTVQLNTMFDKLIALFFVPDGQGPAVLGYAHFLYQLPLGVFGIALATAIFPVLAEQAARNDRPALAGAIDRGLRLSTFIALPATVGLILVSTPLVKVLFQRGEFGAEGTGRVAFAVACYSIGLCAYSAHHILIRAFYSIKDSTTPARVSVIVVAFNLALNLVLVFPLREAGVALATAISAILQVAWLGVILAKRTGSMRIRALAANVGKTAIATAVMGTAVWAIVADRSLSFAVDWPAWAKVAVAVPVGCAVFAGIAKLLRLTELDALLRRHSR
jgi:putative peptidoglycan lipid II flippase